MYVVALLASVPFLTAEMVTRMTERNVMMAIVLTMMAAAVLVFLKRMVGSVVMDIHQFAKNMEMV